jgi:hypothetical protein
VRSSKRSVFLLALVGCGGNTGAPPPQAPPPNAVGGFALTLPEVTLAPGEELNRCWVAPLDVQGPSRIVGGARLVTSSGMHHGNIVARPKSGDGLRLCDQQGSSEEEQATDVLNGGAVLFGSTTQLDGTEWQSFPAGMGYRVGEGLEIVARMHYLNASAHPVTVAPSYQWYTLDEATLTHELGPFVWSYSPFTIPPLADTTVRGDCQFPEAMHVVSVLPHMHKLGTAFRAGYLGGDRDGQLWLDSPGYDPEQTVIRQYDPAVDLSQGAGAWFSCSWHNTLDEELHYGIGDNEMCILFGYAWPVAASYSVLAKAGNCVTFGSGG